MSNSMDIESLERRNDASIAALGEKSALLKNVRVFCCHITSSIHGEINTQHSILDRLSLGVGGAQMGIGGTVNKVKRVMEGPNGKQTMIIAGVIVVALFILYSWSK